MSYKIRLNSILALAYLLSLLIFFSACSDDDDPIAPGPEEPANKRTGFVSHGFTSSGSRIMKYFEELPTGTVDVSDGTDFVNPIITSVNNGALFTRRPDGSPGFSKMVVNAEGEIIEEAFIPLSIAGIGISVRDSLTGVFEDPSNPDVISVFNPTTMEVTGSINMSAGFVPGDVPQQYAAFIFRGDDVFAPITGVGGTIFTDLIVHQANFSTNTFVGDTRREGNGSGSIQPSGSAQGLDAAGNLYIPDIGNLFGDDISARLNKIPAGSNEIDPTYVFEPGVTLNPQNMLFPLFFGFRFLESGKAIALVNSELPQEVQDIVNDAGSFANITPEQFVQIQLIVVQAETALWCELDVDARTVTPIEGIPDTKLFDRFQVFEYNGDAYLQVNTAAESALYRWDPVTGAVSKAFVMDGLSVPVMYNIGEDF